MIPSWLHVVAMISLWLAFASTAYLAVLQMQHPQKMWIMNVVWPVTALYFGPVAIWAYFAMGRGSAKDAMDPQQMKARKAAAARVDDKERSAQLQTGKPYWKIVTCGVTHCGSGCTLGDVIAEFGIFFLVGGAVTGGAKLGLDYAADFTLAFLLGVAFQYFTLAPMRGISGWKGIVEATKVDALSLIAFEVGLSAWMALTQLALFKPELAVATWTYWFMMQIGMIVGYFTSYPMNWWLIKHGIKEAM